LGLNICLFFLYWQFLTTEFGFAKEFLGQGVFLYFHVSLCGNGFLGPEKEKKSLNRGPKFYFLQIGGFQNIRNFTLISKYGILLL
jgi:hypothetical protein